MKAKSLSATILIVLFAMLALGGISFFVLGATLPRMIAVEDYKPLVVSQVFSRDGEEVGEFYLEKRIVIPFSRIPKQLVQAFISAEDSHFFEHSGINLTAIARAALADLKAGHSAQGGSTITQQVAKSLLHVSEKTFTRKIKEIILALRLEKHLKKEDILYLYLNQIYLGHGAYGVEAAAQNYFRKHVEELTIAECAILAGLPQAPGKFTPLLNPQKAKDRQIYVLGRMAEEGYISREEARAAAQEEVKVYIREAFEDAAPFYMETVRQFLVDELGEEQVLEQGIKVYTAMDAKKQLAAQTAMKKNLRDLDKRQGFRGPTKNLTKAEDIAAFLAKTKEDLITNSLPYRVFYPDGKDHERSPLDLKPKGKPSNLPTYMKVDDITDGVVTKIDSKLGLVTVRVAENIGLIDIEDMQWARKPDTTKHWSEDLIRDPALALKIGDVVEVKVKTDKFVPSARLDKILNPPTTKKKPKKPAPDQINFAEFLGLSLEQEPVVEAAVLSFDLETGDVISMVGGINFKKSEYNRALQAARQTGSAFKAITYSAALDKGYAANSIIQDAPVVLEEGEGQETKKWKPGNFENKFTGDVLFRNAIIKSLNIPTIKITEKIGVNWIAKYARRLGIFSPLNMDLTMSIGSSSITLYEITKAYSTFAKAGHRLHPILIKKVTDFSGKNNLLQSISLDKKFETELNRLEIEFHPELAAKLGVDSSGNPLSEGQQATPAPSVSPSPSPSLAKADENTDKDKEKKEEAVNPFDFKDPDQLISPQTAYLTTHLLKGVVLEGTGYRAKAIGRPSAGKTGTTNGYYDAWYVGYTPQIITGVWVGFDDQKALGRLETGSSAAAPIWVDYMKEAIAGTPSTDFAVPPGIVFANIDAETGKLASIRSKKSVREAFREGSEPTSSSENSPNEEKNFFKEDLSD